MFVIYFISYGCNDSALVFLGGAEASASPSFALPMFITIKKIIILHLFLGVPAATVGGTGTPWHTRGYAPEREPFNPGSERGILTILNIYNSYGFNLDLTTYVMQVSWFWENGHKGHLLSISQSFTECNQKLNCKIEMTILKSWEGQWLHWNDEVPLLLVSVELSGLIQGQCPDNVSTKKKAPPTAS